MTTKLSELIRRGRELFPHLRPIRERRFEQDEASGEIIGACATGLASLARTKLGINYDEGFTRVACPLCGIEHLRPWNLAVHLNDGHHLLPEVTAKHLEDLGL